jgi:hypothetical protein
MGNQLASSLAGNLGLGGGNWASGTGNYAQYLNPDYGMYF